MLLALSGLGLNAQNKTSEFSELLEKYKIKPSVGFQMWTTYTDGMEVYNAATETYEVAENRLNTQLRRTRLGVKGQPFEDLSFNFTAALDLVGKDLLSATEAGGNNGSSPTFRVWNAFVQWRLLPKKEYAHLVAGYQVLPIGRESITSALRSTSMEKSWSQNYLRRHLTGIGPGRAMGLNLGGLFLNEHSNVHFEYNLGVFNPVFEAVNGNSTGLRSSPMIAGRAIIHIGDPESQTFSMNHKINYFGKRKGISLAFAVAEQGRTDLFRQNRALGGDVLLNYGGLNIDGEYYYLSRSSFDLDASPSFATHGRTGYARVSYDLNLPRRMVLEPVAMYSFFRGAMEEGAQSQAQSLKSFAGKDETFDLGANLYWNPDFKISLHYTWRWGDAGTGGEGVTFNNYFQQSGLGAIRRGNWLGLGLVLIV
ncbi:hypothetical protein CRP01_19350 [Flavilitoribacter nigricans DSM 23189 = NBRC 102662]|uniref:Porin n=1 Tax=Flavilitoribacter nigricans (strain ATCC 23147 / DSM 23189 / NBRC 102662 / NCIMB 1420 / SS-2) TaxID=1122177 RepID=A0A2D0N8G0_FLAN2|nr:hypothetical protein CRP01_19350 [Flavilitoribacter nigricans DSM 23189 = NBRC 102662]